MSKNIIMDNWVDEFSRFMALECFKLVNTVGSPKGKKARKALMVKFLRHYIDALVTSSLTEHKVGDELSVTKAYTLTRQNLLDVRQGIQEEVANGFSEAVKKYTGHYVDYYVTINEVPEPKNKEVC